MFNLNLPTLLAATSLLALIDPVTAFDYKSAIQTSNSRGPSGVIPNRYVLEFDNSEDARQVAKRDGSGSLHDHIYAQLRSRGIDYSVAQTYDSDLFVGASVGLANSDDYDTLAGMTGISAIWPVSYIPAPLAFTSSWGEDQKTGYHPEWNVENLARAGTKRAFEDVILERRKNNKHSTTSSTTMPSSTSAATPAPSAVLNNTAQPQAMVPNGYGFLPMSGVDRVHAEGNTGQGVKIAIVDSGVFYTNPALGGCFGPGCLVAGGRDYVGDEFDGVNGLAPDDDPLDCTGHGTFVSGIVGAQLPNRYNVSGVAPGASIYAYRVFSCYSATTNDIVAKAMEDAFIDGNDIINLSLGETSSWSGSMLSVIGARIAARGVSVMASAGNGGYAGTFYTESPGTGVDVLSVGAVDNVNFPGQNATLSFRQQPLQYIGLDNIEAGTFPLVSFTNGAASNNDGCPVPADLAGIDFSTTVLVYQQSNATGCDIYTQGYALADAGVQRALLIASPGAEILPPRFGFQLGVISYADGQEILQQIAQGNRPFGTFAFAPNAVANPLTGGLVSLGSALGPTNDMYMKPQLVAPGNNIVSTAPTASGFGASGGTSYSCSYVAGVAALYLSANGGRASSGISAREITRALEITSNPLPVSNTDSRLNTLAIAGSGLIQAYDAIHTPIKVSKSELLLNDTANFADYQTFDVVNTGNDRLKFTLSHTPAQTAYSFKQGSYESELAPVPLVDNAARVKFVPPVLNLKPGQSKTVVVKFDLPQGLDERRLPIYSGFVQVQAGNGQYQVQVPYLGVAASMKSFPVLDYTTTYTNGDALPNLVDGSMSVQKGPQTYTLNGTDAPTLMYRLWVGSPLLTVDLINPNQSLPFKPTIDSPTYSVPPTSDAGPQPKPRPGKGPHGNHGKHLGAGPLSWWNWNGGQGGPTSGVDYADAQIVGNVYERVYIPRNSDGQDGNGIYNYAFNGTFSNATAVSDGSYRLLVRALRVSGNADDEADYDSWVSPVVNIARTAQA